MLYFGHFSFEEQDGKTRHGYLTCMIEADSLDDSLTGFRELLNRIQKEKGLFKKPAAIYLDVIIQSKNIPKEGLVAHLVRQDGELAPSTSIALPAKTETENEAFAVVPDSGSTAEVEIDPFMSFE